MEKIVENIRSLVNSRWKLDSVYGLEHWDIVFQNGQKLLTPEVHTIVVELFAYLHDSCREDNFEDIHHGERAAEWIKTLRHTYLKELSDEDFQLLYDACYLHTTTDKTGNPTIDACFDADRLDLWRVGIMPDPKRMATKIGAEIAQTFVDAYNRYLHENLEVPFDKFKLYSSVKSKVFEKATKMAELELGIKEGETMLGMCHFIWSHAKRIFKDEYKIDWKTPTEMNPGVKFD